MRITRMNMEQTTLLEKDLIHFNRYPVITQEVTAFSIMTLMIQINRQSYNLEPHYGYV